MVEAFIRRHITMPLSGKRLLWKKHVRVFCDGGFPKWRWYPRFRRLYYDRFWGMTGFALYLFGREFNFSFREDRNNLYKETNAEFGICRKR